MKAAQKDSHIKGVIGWPHSQDTLDAVGVLTAAHIPIISPTASSSLLSGISSYFFRIAATDEWQGRIAAQYAHNTLRATKVAVFVDNKDLYSQSLATAFEQVFKAITNNNSIVEEPYTEGHLDTVLNNRLNDALTHNPDLIFYAGYSHDANKLLDQLPTSGQYANLKVLGGDGLYVFDGYPPSSHNRLYFTAFAYPDMWGPNPSQPFFCEYSNDFDPKTLCPGPNTNTTYGSNRAQADVMLTYDALKVFLTAAQTLLNKTFTPQDLRNAIATMKPIQGITGRIEFIEDDSTARGNTLDKVVVVLRVDADGHTQMDDLEGCLKLASC